MTPPNDKRSAHKSEGWKPKTIWILTLRSDDGKRKTVRFCDVFKTNYENLCEAREYAERLLWDSGKDFRWTMGFIEESSEHEGVRR